MRWNKYIIFFAGTVLVTSCSGPGDIVKVEDTLPVIFPDYTETVIPVNIAPLNFKITDNPEKAEAIIRGENEKIRIRGKDKIIIPAEKWRRLLRRNSGGSLTVTLFARRDGIWNQYKPFTIYVEKEPVDPFIVYRLIAPGYETWSGMGIYQRNLATFEQQPIIDNRLLPGACMNCHSFRANDPSNMMFHLRGSLGSTIIVQNGNVTRFNTKNKETISNCIYPFWHPSEDFIAYSVNNIQQVFHSVKDKRIEVFDLRSDIVVYDIRKNKLITSKIIQSDESFETFPAFSPDGKSLVFCSAKKGVQPDDYDKIKYSLCRIDFNASSGSFGNRIDTLVSSFQTGKSVSYPRISPDGKRLIFTLSDYGNFSIWHREADLYMLDLETGDFQAADVLNSTEAESYHSWSSNSRWLIFSSRRMDGLYTRPFIAYIGDDGSFRKPFMVPQKDPEYYEQSLRSFNVPEFVTGKVLTDGRSMLKAIDSPAKDVNFELKE
jgi:WD40 repeat protein